MGVAALGNAVPFVGPLTIEGEVKKFCFALALAHFTKRFSGNLMADEKYDQEFFLALAAKGKDAWNAWQHDRAVRVTFAGVDFSEAPKDQIDFSGFEFGHHANFSKCKWRGAEWRECEDNRETFTFGRACFTSATFGHGARFYSAAFGNGADFSGVKLDHDASFPNAVFGHGAFFEGTAFGNRASFDSAAFGTGANFNGAAFGDEASFKGATLGDHAIFVGATLGDHAIFLGATLGDHANFGGAAFGNHANFTGATFGGQTYFSGAAFGWETNFADIIFKNRVEFTGRSDAQWIKVLEAVSPRMALTAVERQRYEKSWQLYDSGPQRFSKISFARARFYGEATFSGRSFERAANFTQTRFYSPPNFDAATNVANIDFAGAYIGFVTTGKRPWTQYWATDSQIPLRLRALRKIAEETKNHDLERDLYIEERKAERGVYLNQLLERDELDKKLRAIADQKKHVWLEWRLQRRARNAHWLGLLAKPSQAARLIAHLLWIAVMGVYWALADYGRSFVRPLAALIMSGFVFYWGYGKVLAPLMPQPGTLDAAKYERAVGVLALGNTVPFVGPLTIDSKVKEFLFCPCRNCLDTLIPPEGYQWLVLGQNLFSITCVFFIGLALRNYFRIK